MSSEKFNVECPHCEYRFLLDVEFAGEETRCFMCGKTFKVPVPPVSEIRDDTGASGGGAPEAEAGASAGKAKTREQAEEATAVRGEVEEPDLKAVLGRLRVMNNDVKVVKGIMIFYLILTLLCFLIFVVGTCIAILE